MLHQRSLYEPVLEGLAEVGDLVAPRPAHVEVDPPQQDVLRAELEQVGQRLASGQQAVLQQTENRSTQKKRRFVWSISIMLHSLHDHDCNAKAVERPRGSSSPARDGA